MSLFSSMLQPILEREKQKQLEKHFQEQLKLSKSAAGRASLAASDVLDGMGALAPSSNILLIPFQLASVNKAEVFNLTVKLGFA